MTVSSMALDAAVLNELRELGRELDQDVLGEVVSAYRKLGPELLSQMAEAASTGALDVLARAAHTLKGGSAQIGAREVSELARVIESDARDAKGDDVAALVERCRGAFEMVDTALAREIEGES